MQEAFKFDPFDDEFRANPYPTYHRMLREQRMLHVHQDWFNSWCVFGYEDIFALLRHPNLGHRSVYDPIYDANRNENDFRWIEKFRDHYDNIERSMLMKNPPEHTRLRSLVHKAFTPRILAKIEADIQSLADDLIDKAESKGSLELMSDLALPLPVSVITRMLGIPDDRTADLNRWSNAIFYLFNGNLPEEDWEIGLQATHDYTDYLTEVVEERKQKPQNDLLTELINAEEDGHRLSHDELLSNVMLLLNAGHETTVSLIGSAMLTLFENPEQFNLLKNNLDLMPDAVEEVMRYCSPVQMIGRAVLEPFEYKGHEIKPEHGFTMYVGASNRDPEVFDNPEKFDITREKKRNLGFGFGVHFCLGAPLARMEANIVLSKLIERFPEMSLVEANPQYKDGMVIRCLDKLQIAL